MTSPEILVKKQTIAFDATLLTSVMECGLKTDLRHNHNLEPLRGKSNSLEVGSIVHKVLEVYYQTIINGIHPDDAIGYGLAAGELYIRGCPTCLNTDNGSCGHKRNEYPGIENTPIDNENDKIGWRYALDSCEEYHARWRNDSWRPVAVEHVLTKEIYSDDNIRVLWKAKIDLLTNTFGPYGIVSMDHKTMKQKRTNLSMNNQFIGQCIVTENPLMFINKFGWQKTLQPHEKFMRSAMNFSEARINEWRYEIVPYWAYKLLEYHEEEYYPPNWTSCNSQYGWCVFWKLCDADPHVREELIRKEFTVGDVWDVSND